MVQKVNIFLAYSKEDIEHRDKLTNQFSPYERNGKIDIWHDGEIIPGEEWEAKIKNKLNEAHIILLLLSPDALASDYFYEQELPNAIQRHRTGMAKVVPVIVRDCQWQATDLVELQALPKEAHPIVKWIFRDEAYNDIVNGVMREVARLLGEELEEEEIEDDEQEDDEDDLFIEEVNGVSFNMIFVEGGTFTMGCTKEQGSSCNSWEKPSHEVNLDSFYIGETLVTQGLWKAIMGENPSIFTDSDDLPIENITWEDADDFIEILCDLTGNEYRLLSEAEWEFAARGGNLSEGYKYSGSDSLEEVAWFGDNSQEKTHPVGKKLPNELGLYDMSGNVWELCDDTWHENYKGAPNDGSAWVIDEDLTNVVRGGDFLSEDSSCRITERAAYDPDEGIDIFVGLRLALSV
jgi:formylglycine-generating enzyme required for sulfatase activity